MSYVAHFYGGPLDGKIRVMEGLPLQIKIPGSTRVGGEIIEAEFVYERMDLDFGHANYVYQGADRGLDQTGV